MLGKIRAYKGGGKGILNIAGGEKVPLMSPKIIDVTKPQLRTIRTVDNIFVSSRGKILGKGTLEAGRVGKGGRSVNRFIAELRGGEQPFSLASYNKLTRSEKALFQKGLELELGRPIPEKFVPSFLGRTLTEKQFSSGALETQKLFKISTKLPKTKGFPSKVIKPGEVRITLFKPGRTITQAQVGSISEEVKTISIGRGANKLTYKLTPEQSEKLMFSRVFVKTQTGVMPSTGGKVTELRGVTAILDPIPETKGAEFIIGSGKSVLKQTPKLNLATTKTLATAKVVAL